MSKARRAKAQIHLDLLGRKFAFFSPSLRREEDTTTSAHIHTKQNKTNAPLNGGIFELSSNWWSFAFLIGTTNCCARRWTTTGRQTYYVCCSQSVIFLWGSDYQHKTKTVHSKPKREIFRWRSYLVLLEPPQKNTLCWGAAPDTAWARAKKK